jgi:hypothetical protein
VQATFFFSMAARAGFGAAVLLLAGCQGNVVDVPAGSWGGRGIEVVVAPEMTRFQFDCAHGRFNGAFQLDASGRFSRQGVFILEGGPTSPGPEVTQDAVYRGRLEGDTMSVEVTVTPGPSPGSFTAVRDEPARLLRCR